MSTRINDLKKKLGLARSSAEQYEAAINILQYCLPHPATLQNSYPYSHDRQVTKHLKQFILGESKETLQTLEALKTRLQDFDSTTLPKKAP